MSRCEAFGANKNKSWPKGERTYFENMEYFTEFGFEIDEFDENEVVIRSVPVMNFRTAQKIFFRNIIKILKRIKKQISEKVL